VVLTTTNGTRALLRAAEAERAVAAAFVNFSAACELLRQDARPVHIICAGSGGEPALEDTLLAGGFVEFLSAEFDVALNDSARLAWDCFENHGRVLAGALEVSAGGALLRRLGYEADVTAAAQVDQFSLVPELVSDPPRLERRTVGVTRNRWPG
jgi:2-phosphosulfolactate phosphatase